MKRKIIIDTSSLVDYLRNGKGTEVPALIISESCLLSKVVRLELLKGVSRSGRSSLIRLFEGMEQINEFAAADKVEKALLTLHGRGLNLGLPDLLILTDALLHKAAVLTSDRQMQEAAKLLGVQTVIAMA